MIDLNTFSLLKYKDCKSVYPGSIPGVASRKTVIFQGNLVLNSRYSSYTRYACGTKRGTNCRLPKKRSNSKTVTK